MAKARRERRPSFLWQGILIVLPAAALTAVGLTALRQDRLFFRQQAAEQSHRIANHAVQVLLPSALEASPPQVPDVTGASALPTRPAEDSVFAMAQRAPNWTVCLVDGSGGLIYPVPDGAPLEPEDGSRPGLSASEALAWNSAQQADGLGSDPVEAIAAYQRFLTGAPPDWLVAQANYRIGVLAEKCGQFRTARDQLLRLRQQFPTARSEAGVPLALYADLHLLRLSAEFLDPAERRDLLNRTCAEAVLRFPLLAPAILDQLDGNTPNDQAQVKVWRTVWAAHEQARRVQLAWQATTRGEGDTEESTARWIELRPDEPWLVLSSRAGSNTWLMALPEARAAAWVETALRGLDLPEYLGIQVQVAGRALVRAGGEELASARLAAATTRPSAEVSVRLVNPALLYARQHTRTQWFGGLVGLSCLTMLVGFVAAWGAFRHQQELSELKSNFVSSVSHELRAPIASVRLMAEELEDIPEADAKKSRSYHGFIVQECRRLSALIENVLDFSRHEQGREQYEFEPTDLTALIETTAKLMRTYAADQRIAISTRLPAEVVEIEADGRALQQVLVNLIDNAVKHSPPGSIILVGLDLVPATGAPGPGLASSFWRRWLWHFRRDALCPGQAALRIWVEDQGDGIPVEEQERIFQRFYRPGSELRRETQGVGLGLAIVKYVAEAHGGRVSVRSAVGQGSRFTVELPLSHRPDRSGSSIGGEDA